MVRDRAVIATELNRVINSVPRSYKGYLTQFPGVWPLWMEWVATFDSAEECMKSGLMVE